MGIVYAMTYGKICEKSSHISAASLRRTLRAVGIEEHLHVDGDSFPLETGDRLLLATDGLTNMVDDDALASLLGGEFSDVAKRMAERALAGGGSDNITAIAIAYEMP